MDHTNPITAITIFTEEGEHLFESSEGCQLVESGTDAGNAFIVHEMDADGELLHTTVYPMPGHGGIVAIEIERR
jgi:hypothetical protein